MAYIGNAIQLIDQSSFHQPLPADFDQFFGQFRFTWMHVPFIKNHNRFRLWYQLMQFFPAVC